VFHIGLKPAEIPNLEHPWFQSDTAEGAAVRAAVVDRLGRHSDSPKVDVVDIRREQGFESLRREVTRATNNNERTVVRFGRVAPKNYINDVLSVWCESMNSTSKITTLLYLCDLGRTQAVDAIWIISRYFPRPVKNPNDALKAAIYIVTEDLCCVQLRISFTKRSDGSSTAAADLRPVSQSRLPNGIAYIACALRDHDSQQLWKRIRLLNESANPPILIKNVLWTSKSDLPVVLPWYINFSALVQDRDAARYVRRGLRRVLALFPDANDNALDPIVEAPLHDAKKWLVRPETPAKKIVLIGSLSVSGSTLRAFSSIPGVTVVGAIDCMQTPYYFGKEQTAFPRVSALLWDAELPQITTELPQFRRIGATAYIEPIGPRAPPPSIDAGLYRALETDRLAKTGHWTYVGQHSLIDINAELAIEQSAAVGAGVIIRIAEMIRPLLARGPVCLAFPFTTLSYRLAHTVFEMLPPASKDSRKLLAISFLPRSAGGLTYFAPLTEEAARATAMSWPDTKPIAVFLDIGFLSSRTFRHASRQLRAAGFAEVRAIGLLNRSSSPDPRIEGDTSATSDTSVPTACWRWHVPTLGRRSHCRLCAALQSLAKLREIVVQSHADLLPSLERVTEDWQARDVADFWGEHGIAPKALSAATLDAVRKLPLGLQGSPPSSSLMLVARTIEAVRLTGDIDEPLRIAAALVQVDAETVVDLLCCVLMLAGGAFTTREREAYTAALVSAIVNLDAERPSASPSSRSGRLIGLAALALSNQETSTRLAVLEELVKILSVVEIHDPLVRLALTALTIDAGDSARVQDQFQALCSGRSASRVLVANYHGIRSRRANVPETWSKLVRVFGRSSSHSQQSDAGILRSRLRNGQIDANSAIPELANIANLLAQCHLEFVDISFAVNLPKLVEALQGVADRVQLGELSSLPLAQSIDNVLNPVAQVLHTALLRIGNGASSPSVWMLFEPMFGEQAKRFGLSTARDVLPTIACRQLTWPEDRSGYVPLCRAVQALIKDIFENVKSWGHLSLPPDQPAFEGMPQNEARLWWHVEKTAGSLCDGVTLILLNGVPRSIAHAKYTPVLGYLSDSLFKVASEERVVSRGREYFEIRIEIPVLSRILQEAI